MVTFGTTSYSKRLLHLVSWSHWFTFFNIVVAIALSTIYLVNESSPDSLVGYIYLITTWLSHMAFITFMTFVLTIFPLTLIYPRTRFIRASASLFFTLVLLLLLLDAFVFNRLGYHIGASTFSQTIDLISQEIIDEKRKFWFISILLFGVILAFELVVSNYAWKHLKQLQKTVFARYTVAGLVAAFFTSHLIHIWADANLHYDVLRQDNVLPVSYPSTAKTLLTKYGFFDTEDYLIRRKSPLSFVEDIPKYPTINAQCSAPIKKQSTFLIFTKNNLTLEQRGRIAERTEQGHLILSHHVDSSLFEDAWFNVFFGLPNIYKQQLLKRNTKPMLFQELKKQNLTSSYSLVRKDDKAIEEKWHSALFSQVENYKDISSLVFEDELKKIKPGLHVIYFDDENPYQFELFMDALLLNQRHKDVKDNIWVSSIGNHSNDTNLSIKPALLIWPSYKDVKNVENLTSQMDISATLLRSWLGCPKSIKKYYNGRDLFMLDKDRILANTVNDGLIVFNKDKSVFIDQDGNFQSYSRKLQMPITVKSDLPMMIDGVHFIKRFSKSDQ